MAYCEIAKRECAALYDLRHMRDTLLMVRATTEEGDKGYSADAELENAQTGAEEFEKEAADYCDETQGTCGIERIIMMDLIKNEVYRRGLTRRRPHGR